MQDHSARPLATAIFGACLLAVLVFGFLRFAMEELRPSDDVVWLYLCGVQLLDPGSANALDARLLEAARWRKAEQESLLRLQARADYRENYYVVSIVSGVLSRLNGVTGLSDARAYGRTVGRVVIQGAAFSWLAAVVLVIAGIAAARSTVLLAGLLLSACLQLVFSVASPEPGSFLFFRSREGWSMVSNIMAFIANPSGQFSIFGFSPRSLLFVLALLVFAWRWCGWWRASYLLTLLLAFIHQSMAALLLTTIVCIDVVVRPRTLVRADVLPWVLLAVGVFAWRESLWRYILPGEEARSLWLALAGVFVVSVALAALFLTRSRLGMWRRGLSLRISVLPTYVSDSVLLSVGWLITLPIGYLLARHVGLLEGTYFWYQIHARLLALYQPVIIFGVATGLLMRYRLLAGTRLLVAVPVVTVSIALLAMYAARTRVDWEPFLSGMEHLALRTEYSIQGPPTFDNEAVIYMAMARTLDTGTDYLARIFPEPGAQLRTP